MFQGLTNNLKKKYNEYSPPFTEIHNDNKTTNKIESFATKLNNTPNYNSFIPNKETVTYHEGYTPTNCPNSLNDISTSRDEYNLCLGEVIDNNARDLTGVKSTNFEKINADINTNRAKLIDNINKYNELNTNVAKYDVIDNSGNLIYKNGWNFKENIPNLKDAVLEDTIDLVNYQNNIYIFGSIAAATLIVCAIIIVK
jgi:hypothetical protein